MNTNRYIFVANVVALILAMLWVLFDLSFDSLITVITLSVTLFGVWRSRNNIVNSTGVNELLFIDGSDFKSVSNSIKKLKYDERLKVWELLELIEGHVPEALASDYGKTWELKNLQTGSVFQGLKSYIRDKGFLEEEARSVIHIGLLPNTTIKVVKRRT